MAGPIEQWARGDRISAEDQRIGLHTAVDVLAAHGLSVRGIAREDMDAARVARVVLSSAHASLRWLGEAAEEVCREAVGRAYTVLLADPTLLPEIKVAFRQEVLHRLESTSGPETRPFSELVQTPCARYRRCTEFCRAA